MENKVKKLNKDIYDICVSIHNLTKLDIEFLDHNHKSSFQLFSSQMPFTLGLSRSETILYMYNFLKDKSPKDFFYHEDNFKLSYLGISLWENTTFKGVIIIGPFLSDIPDDTYISKVIASNNLPLSYKLQLHQYYKSLKIFSLLEYSNLGCLMVTLAASTFIHANILVTEKKDIIVTTKEKNEIETEKFYSEVELRYSMEKKFMSAVEKGLTQEALSLVKYLQFNVDHRIPNNPLRARKNLAFTPNVLLRLAAEQGGVSPVYLHNTSDKFSILIERVSTMNELDNLQIAMITEYCDLVKKLSTAGYSPTIQKAISYINLHFENTVSLNIIAEKLNLNSSHLSRQFKKETGLTITDYINRKRINEAKHLIEQNNNSITEIALIVGFTNHNYFCTVFKQIMNLTPTEYLNKSKIKE